MPGAVTNPLGSLSLPSSTVDFDQALKFRAAAALLQEVSLLNHYVRDAAVRTGTRPYIVRMLVTELPSARNEPYDAYTTLSFFVGDNTNVLPARSSAFDHVEARIHPAAGRFEHPNCSSKPVRVIPLLVTDDIESSLHSNTSEVLRDLAAVLQAVQGNTGFAAGLRNHAEDLDKTLNRNLNSIYTLGQAAPNAVQVRLGAAFANGRYVTVARTYNISLLLLIETERPAIDVLSTEIIPCPAIGFNSRTLFRDAVSGKTIDSSDDRTTSRVLERFASDAGIPRTVPFNTLGRWVKVAASGDFDRFSSDLKHTAEYSDADIAVLWTHAVTAAQVLGRSSGEFVVDIPKVELPQRDDRFTLLDDGQSTTLAINHALNLQEDRLYARVKVQLPGRWLYLPNDNVTVGPYGRTATFKFASVKKTIENDLSCKKDPKATVSPCPICNVYSEVVYDRGFRNWQTAPPTPRAADDIIFEWFPTSTPTVECLGLFENLPPPSSCIQPLVPVPPEVLEARRAGIIDSDEIPISYFVTAKPDSAKPDFMMALTAHQILAARDGTGAVVVALRGASAPRSDMHFRVTEGAFIDSVISDPAGLAVNVVGTDRIVGDGLYKLNLKNLVPGSQVTIHAFRPDNTGGELTVPDETAHVVSDRQLDVVIQRTPDR